MPTDPAAPDPSTDAPQGGAGRAMALVVFVMLAPLVVFGAMLGVDHALGAPGFSRAFAVRVALPPATSLVGLPRIEGPADPARPLVVIDAGHGGHDPGAHGDHVQEKDLTLTLARALRDRLLAVGGIRVALTRDDDRYLLLEERSGIARRMRADLFVSIHADSADEDSASGATLYTLSARGSSEQAERMAAQENRADSVNGVPLARNDSHVSAILVDLAQRHTAELSTDLARLILREGEGRISFRERALQSAAFVVLKSPDVPSVLFEAGYITNPQDAARLRSAEGRAGFAEATAQAIRIYFARQSEAPSGGASSAP